MPVRLAIAVLFLASMGCSGSSTAPQSARHHRPPDTSAGPRVRRVVNLRLARGHSRGGFVTRYPGGSFAMVVSAPRRARYHVAVTVAGIRADGFPRFRRDACTRHGSQLVCQVGPFEAIPNGFGPWRVTVVKTSRPRARVRVRLRFTGPN